MKRVCLAALAAMMLVGCAAKQDSTVKASAAGPAKADYFEYKKDGQVYVFGSIESMQKFVKTGKADTVPEYFKGRVVNFESAQSNRLVAEYGKQNK